MTGRFHFSFCVLVTLFACSAFVKGQSSQWKQISEGLFLGEFDSPQKSELGDSKVTIVKIDPKFYSFKLLSASEHGNVCRTAKQWCVEYHLISAINAGMFQAGGIRNVGYMKNFGHVNNPKLNNYNAVLAFNRVDSTGPEIQLVDLKCLGFADVKSKYQTLIQNLRMISCQQKNTWSKQERRWSMAVLGMDATGHILFIFTRSPYSVHDFSDVLLSLPIAIHNAMYLEGGPEATLYLSSGEIELEMFGSYETGFNENDYNPVAWPIPNVIGIVRKSN
jgi:hypothetical protein